MENLKQELLKLDENYNKIEKSIKDEDLIIYIKNKLLNSKKHISNFDFNEVGNIYGIYLFYIQPKQKYTLKSFNKEWDLKQGFRKFPKVIKSRFEYHNPININKLYPLYLGKSEKLASRINEHITHKRKHSTYGLKLCERENFKKNEIYFSFYSLSSLAEFSNLQIKQFLILQIEKKLREELNPWIGKQ